MSFPSDCSDRTYLITSSDHGSVKNKEQGVVAAGEAGGRGGRRGG